jgi:alpha-beta hydrolase superfamily lysophospholipase
MIDRTVIVAAHASRARGVGYGVGVAVTIGAVIGALAGGAVTAISHKVVTPDRRRTERVRIHAIDASAATVTLERSADTELGGRYSLWFGGGTGHLRVGEVIDATPTRVIRRIISIDGGDPESAQRGRWGGWFYLTPAELDDAVEDVDIDTPVGPAPAWVVRADDPDAPWAIFVHGRGVTRAETIRALPVFRAAGYSVLLASWRNDGVAPRADGGRYGLGATEWHDIDAALGWVAAQGARDVVLMGWSMGGAVSLQTLVRSQLRGLVRGVVLESPVVDWKTVLRSQAIDLRVPRWVRKASEALMRTPVLHRLAGLQQPLDIRELDMVQRSDELDVPILILHSDDDGFVPSSASHDLARARPDIVTLRVAHRARHTKLWNYDSEWFDTQIMSWLRSVPSLDAGRDRASRPSL